MDSSALSLDSVITAAEGLIVAELSGEVVILSLRNGVYYGLDRVGALIWRMIQQPATIASLCEAVARSYEVTVEQCVQDLYRLVEQLAAAGLIEVQYVQPSAQVATA